MKSKKANVYVIIGVIIIFLLFIAGVFLVSNLRMKKMGDQEVQESEKLSENQENVKEVKEKSRTNCEIDEDCNDNSACTVDSCNSGICINANIVLCYNGDDCCPEKCNSGNDNDCLN